MTEQFLKSKYENYREKRWLVALNTKMCQMLLEKWEVKHYKPEGNPGTSSNEEGNIKKTKSFVLVSTEGSAPQTVMADLVGVCHYNSKRSLTKSLRMSFCCQNVQMICGL